MPTTLPMRGSLALDRRQQIRDVVALEQELAQRLERGAPLIDRRARLTVPLLARRRQPMLVLVALRFDRLARRGEAGGKRRRVGARLAQVANLVELLVQRE